MKTNRTLREELENCLKQEMEKIFRDVPFTREFHAGGEINGHYFKRHLLETILRIRLNNEADAYCLHKIMNREGKLAHKLALYLAEESGHDNMFLADLERFGITKEEVDNSTPFFSTEILIGYLYFGIQKDGAMPTMIWNWFVEWYSDHYNLNITEKAATTYGSEKVKGSMAHFKIDEHEDHVGLMFSTVEDCIKSPEDVEKTKQYISRFLFLIKMYFQELYDATIAKQSKVNKRAA